MSKPENESRGKRRKKMDTNLCFQGDSDPELFRTGKNKTKATNRTKPKKRK